MCVKTGVINNMSFYIGPGKEGFKAEVTINGNKEEKDGFVTFDEAVEWVDTKEHAELDKNETERSKEE